MSLRSSCALLLFLFSGAAGWAAATAPVKDEQLQLAAEVRAIFDAKCTDCHGAELPRPKAKFGYVLDLKRLAANPKFVVPGKPEQSDLYDLISHDEMPGEDANVPPLTVEEKEKVRRWIEIGAPGELPPGIEKETVVPVAVVEPAKNGEPLWKKSLRWVGKFHPASTHFPVGLMFAAVVAELLAWWTRRSTWLETVRFLVILAALGGLATTGLGWLNAYFSSYDKAPGALLWWHRWLGTGTAVWAAICAILVCVAPCGEGSKERQRFRGALLLGAVLVGLSGFLGSALIYGLDHYAWN
jgi:uncharacterized membrane protein